VKEINYIMQISDLNGDGQIDFYEFVKAFSDKFSSETKSPKQNQFSNIKKKLTPKILKQLKRSFMEIDTNHDRVISPSELKTFL
jgi:Ca2+-binding EF-hand superfamily protein